MKIKSLIIILLSLILCLSGCNLNLSKNIANGLLLENKNYDDYKLELQENNLTVILT